MGASGPLSESLAIDPGENAASLFVEAEPTRRRLEAGTFELHQHVPHQLRGVARRPSHGLADAHHGVCHRATAELDLLAHNPDPKSDVSTAARPRASAWMPSLPWTIRRVTR